MTLNELEELLNLCGSQPDDWPIDLRQSALLLISRNANAQSLLDQYDVAEQNLVSLLDQLASQEAIPEFPGLEASVMQQQLPKPSHTRLDQLLDWLLPRSGYSGLQFWRPAMAACLPLVFGMLLGNVFSFGIDANFESVENWDDELYLLSLNDYVENIL